MKHGHDMFGMLTWGILMASVLIKKILVQAQLLSAACSSGPPTANGIRVDIGCEWLMNW